MENEFPKLEELPMKIRDKANEAITTKMHIEAYKLELEQIKSDYYLKVSMTMNEETGKPMYSNAETRKAKCDELLAADEKASKMVETIASHEIRAKREDIECDYLRNCLRVYEIQARNKGD